MKTKPILCVDFDGTIHPYTKSFKGAGVVDDEPVVKGFFEWLFSAVELFDVQIYSSRSRYPEGVVAMRLYMGEQLQRWCRKVHNMPDSVCAHHWQTLCALQFPTEKPAAFLTLDDRAYTFTGTWPDPVELRAFKPWNKQ